jgi:hypothetical protein
MGKRAIVLTSLAIVVLVALIVATRSGNGNAGGETQTVAPTLPGASAPAQTPAVSGQATPTPEAVAAPAAQRVPHYHERLEDARPLPKILPAGQFRIPVVARAYRIAARIPEVLAQQPCYCWCDKIGHGSLVDCFATDHGAG